MANYVLKAESGGRIKFSSVGFRLLSQDYFKCFLDFKKPKHFSVLPYFLCCRAIELALKSIHLETKNQSYLKSNYRHDLIKTYKNLPKVKQTLLEDELTLLSQINEIYYKKDFEYINVHDVATGFNRFPDIHALAKIARKLTDFCN